MNRAIKIIKTLRILCLGLVTVSALLLPLSAFSQGSLTPPGAPAPRMKKLDEVEPRTNLQATPVPGGVDTSSTDYHFIINHIRNSASDNTLDYAIAVNNRYGPIVDISAAGAPAVSGNTASDTTGTVHPWANFSY